MQALGWWLGMAMGLWLGVGTARAYPVFEAVTGLSSPESLTVYPDDTSPQLFYVVPTSFAFARDDKGKPRLGVQYWGLTGVDPEGAGASFRVSIQPSFDQAALDRVGAELRKRNPKAVYVFPDLVDSGLDVILNGSWMPGSQDTASPASTTGGKQSPVGGTVDSTQAFTIAVSNAGARVFERPAASADDVIAARYRYRFLGVGKRLHAEVTLYPKRIYDYFKADEAREPWRPTIGNAWQSYWQALIRQGAVTLRVLDSGDPDAGAYMTEVLNLVAADKIDSQTLFTPEVRADARVNTPGTGSFGWVLGDGRAWAATSADTKQTYLIDTKKLTEREVSVGLTFSAACEKYPERFSDLTLIGHKCIDSGSFVKVAQTTKGCLDAKLADLYAKKAAELIPPTVLDALIANAYESPCIAPQEDGRMAAFLTKIHTVGAMSPEALRDATNRCRDTRLADVKKHYATGDISREQWELQVPLVFQVPCRNYVKVVEMK